MAQAAATTSPDLGHRDGNDGLDSVDGGDQEEYLFDRTDVRAIFICLYTVVFVICFLGNLLVIVVVSVSRRMRSRTHLFLVNLAAADLCVGIFCVYQNLSIYLVQSWVLGDVVCKLYHLVHNLSYTASIFVLVLLAVERYLAVLHPIKCRTILRPARLKAAVACVWLAAAGLSASRLFWAQTVTVDLPGLFQEIICISNRHKYDQKLWDVTSFVLLYLVPLGVMAFLYARIAVVLWGSGRPLGLHQQQHQPRVRRGVVKLTVTVVGVFALCHLPLHARRLWQHWSPLYRGPSTFSAVFTPATFLVAYANSAANPILYALLSRNFRSGVRDVLGLIPFRLRSRSGGDSSGSSDSSGSRGSSPRRRRAGRAAGGSILSRTVATGMTELPTIRDHSVDITACLMARNNPALEQDEEA